MISEDSFLLYCGEMKEGKYVILSLFSQTFGVFHYYRCRIKLSEGLKTYLYWADGFYNICNCFAQGYKDKTMYNSQLMDVPSKKWTRNLCIIRPDRKALPLIYEYFHKILFYTFVSKQSKNITY